MPLDRLVARFFIFLKSLISRCRHRPGSVVSPSAATSVDTAIMSQAHMSKIDVAFYTSNLAVIPGLIAQKPSQQDVKGSCQRTSPYEIECITDTSHSRTFLAGVDITLTGSLYLTEVIPAP